LKARCCEKCERHMNSHIAPRHSAEAFATTEQTGAGHQHKQDQHGSKDPRVSISAEEQVWGNQASDWCGSRCALVCAGRSSGLPACLSTVAPLQRAASPMCFASTLQVRNILYITPVFTPVVVRAAATPTRPLPHHLRCRRTLQACGPGGDFHAVHEAARGYRGPRVAELYTLLLPSRASCNSPGAALRTF
jgi:hypothetical protein